MKTNNDLPTWDLTAMYKSIADWERDAANIKPQI